MDTKVKISRFSKLYRRKFSLLWIPFHGRIVMFNLQWEWIQISLGLTARQARMHEKLFQDLFQVVRFKA